MFDETVVDTEIPYLRHPVGMVAEPVGNGTPGPSADHSILDGNHLVEPGCYLSEYLLVEGLDEPHVVMSRFDSVGTGPFDCFGSEIACRSEGYYGQLLSVAQLPSASDFDSLEWAVAPLRADAASARVSDNERTVVLCCREHHVSQFGLIHRCGERDVGDISERCHVEGAMMRSAVFADQSGPVETENHMQVLDGDIVDDIVESPLCK